jgi:hypothetical protein
MIPNQGSDLENLSVTRRCYIAKQFTFIFIIYDRISHEAEEVPADVSQTVA